MKESNKIILEIWMFKIDEPSGRADLHNRPLLDMADIETNCDSARHKSFTGLNHSSAVILLYWTRHKQVFLQPRVSMFLLLANISVSQVWKQMLLILASEDLPCVSCQTPQIMCWHYQKIKGKQDLCCQTVIYCNLIWRVSLLYFRTNCHFFIMSWIFLLGDWKHLKHLNSISSLIMSMWLK